MTRSHSRRKHGLIARLGKDAHGDDGIALVMVVGSMLILAMLAMAALAYTLSSQKFARHDQDYSAAVTAAQSGVEDFISRLNRDDNYGDGVDCTNPAWKGPTTVLNGCFWDGSTAPGWAPVVPGSTDPSAAMFHYAVDATKSTSEGTIMLSVTGRVHGVYRTIETAVGKGGSTDYIYYTDFESADPKNVQAYNSTDYPGGAPANCGGTNNPTPKYWYTKPGDTTDRHNAGCVEITFVAGDTLNGSVFTNDAILSSGASFLKQFNTVNPTCTGLTAASSTWNRCLRGTSTANFNGTRPLMVGPQYLDDTSAAFATDPGCHYTGSTRVIFQPDGTMQVWNAKAVSGDVAPTSRAAPGGSAPNCGDKVALQSSQGANVPVPTGMVIYVAASTAAQRQCYGGEIGGPAGHQLPLGTYAATYAGTPIQSTWSYTADSNMAEANKVCGEGNLYVEGVLKGRTSVAAAQSIIVTGDLVLAGGAAGTDMLGLVATNSVEVFHPRVGTYATTKTNWWCGSNCTYKWADVTNENEDSYWPKRYMDPTTGSNNPASGIQIAGSIQTLQHSFLVQKYNVGGDAGRLFVNGSIAQRWRGIVAQSSNAGFNGYLKLYSYDPRLKFSAPPYFPRWANSQWSLRYSGEVNTPTGLRTP